MAEKREAGLRRVAHMARQARLAPRRIAAADESLSRLAARLDQVGHEVTVLGGRLHALGEGRAAEEAFRGELLPRLSAVCEEVAICRALLDELVGPFGPSPRLSSLETGLAAVRNAIEAPTRDAALASLLEHLGQPGVIGPGLGVHIPSWNHVGFLEGAVSSALACLDGLPSGLRSEVVLVDDGSDDGTDVLIARLAASDRRIRSVRAPCNLGLVRSRAVALHVATTSHALTLDADNLAEPEGVLQLFEAARATRATIVYGPQIMEWPEGERRLTNRRLVSRLIAEEAVVENFSLRDVARLRELGAHRSDPLFDLFEDYALVFRLIRLGEPFCHVPVITGRYRALPLRMSTQVPLKPVRRGLLRAYADEGAVPDRPAPMFIHHTALAGQTQGRPPAAGPRVLVLSSAGVGNAGDDALLLASLERLRRLLPDASLMVATDGDTPPEVGREAVWAGTLSDLCGALEPDDLVSAGDCAEQLAREVGARGLAPALVALERFDLALLHGGGSLADPFLQLLATRLALAAALRSRSVPLLVTGQGLGPLTAERDRARLARLRLLAGSFTVRDALSADLLAEVCGDERAPVDLDDAVGLAMADSHAAASALAEAGLAPGRPYLALTLRAASFCARREQAQRWAAVVDEVALARGLSVVVVPFAWVAGLDDVALALSLAAGRSADWRVAAPRRDARVAAALMAAADLAVASTYHAALFAAAAGVPTAVLAAQAYGMRKARGLVATLGLADDVVLGPDAGASEMLLALDASRPDPARLARAGDVRDRRLQAAIARVAKPAVSGQSM